MSTKQETAFRIGSVYRNKNRDVPVRLTTAIGNGWAECTWGNSPLVQYTHIRLCDGRAGRDGVAWKDTGLHLLPGELHEVNGEWVPVSPLSGDAFDSQALEAAYKAMERALESKDAPDCIAVAPEPTRSPLPYFAEQQERARFDSFREFCTTRSSSDPNHYRGSFGSPDLQKAEHQVSPMFGSAFLRG